MRTFVVAVIIALLTVSSYSQGMFGGKGRHGRGQKSEEQKKKTEEKPYKSPLDKLPDKKFDPWVGVRENPPSK